VKLLWYSTPSIRRYVVDLVGSSIMVIFFHDIAVFGSI